MTLATCGIIHKEDSGLRSVLSLIFNSDYLWNACEKLVNCWLHVLSNGAHNVCLLDCKVAVGCRCQAGRTLCHTSQLSPAGLELSDGKQSILDILFGCLPAEVGQRTEGLVRGLGGRCLCLQALERNLLCFCLGFCIWTPACIGNDNIVCSRDAASRAQYSQAAATTRGQRWRSASPSRIKNISCMEGGGHMHCFAGQGRSCKAAQSLPLQLTLGAHQRQSFQSKVCVHQAAADVDSTSPSLGY